MAFSNLQNVSGKMGYKLEWTYLIYFLINKSRKEIDLILSPIGSDLPNTNEHIFEIRSRL